MRRRSDARAVGTVQATLARRRGDWTATIAWVIGVGWQRQGFASEATVALVGWLRRQGVREVYAHIHPNHEASTRVAVRAGLEPTNAEVEGERVWRGDLEDI